MDNTEKHFPMDPLTMRELEILRLIERGCTNREIAQKLMLSLETIKWYNKQIFSKLGVHNRTQAVASAKAVGLLTARSTSLEYAPSTTKHNLPAQITSFIGRKREIVEVLKLLATNRLLTLSGPPGTGKTRLALQVAFQILPQFENGVYFVDLAPISDPQFVPITIAQVFDFGESGAGSLVEALKNYLRDKRMLLVLDNYEQVIETAPLVGELLAAAPGLKILVTSRQVLQIYGEQEYLVPPLAVPDIEQEQGLRTLSACEAVELFSQRAQAVKPDFALSEGNAAAIAEICVRLDGLPLAIELAAARIKLLSAEMIKSRLESRLETLTGGARDLPSRLQTLRGTIDWSYDLLSEEEKVLLARLSVFQGGRTINAAEEVCATGLSIAVIDGIESLLNKSLLYQEKGPGGKPRFIMLETIHEYAREKLAESGEAERLQRRHAAYFARLAGQVEAEVAGTEQDYWFERLRSEHDNLRTALAFALGSGESELGLQIVGGLRDFWYYSGHVGEGLVWIGHALENAEDTVPDLRAKALNAAGWLSFIQGDFESGELFNRKALALYQELGDETGSAWAMTFLAANMTGARRDIKTSITLSENSLAVFRTKNNIAGIIRALNQTGELARLDNDYDRAGQAYEECISLCRETGNRQREAFSLANLGLVDLYHGNYELAETRMLDSLVLCVELNNKYPIANALAFLSGPVAARGYPKRAAQLLGASNAIQRAMGLCFQPSDQPEIDRFEALVRQQLDKETFKFAWKKGQAMSLEQAIAFALEERPD